MNLRFSLHVIPFIDIVFSAAQKVCWTEFRALICEWRRLAPCYVTDNNSSRCTVGRNNREAGPPPGNDPCHRDNNEKSRVFELWKYEVTKGALCVGIDVVQGWHCAASRGWSSSQDQMPKLGQGEEGKRDRVGGGCNIETTMWHFILVFNNLTKNRLSISGLPSSSSPHANTFKPFHQEQTSPFHQTDVVCSQSQACGFIVSVGLVQTLEDTCGCYRRIITLLQTEASW